MIRIEDMFSGIAMDTIRSKVHLTAILCNFQRNFRHKVGAAVDVKGNFKSVVW
jgi:hypothetical protein